MATSSTRIRIGTRDSRLAQWQAQQVANGLAAQGLQAELVNIASEGDLDLARPLYEWGVEGIFTRSLDAALLSDKIDLAVHSLKDVPTQLAEGLSEAAILPRGSTEDILVFRGLRDRFDARDNPFTIATDSIRRRAQWKHHFPQTRFESLRGNMPTRLQKLRDSDWDGAIFAKAGLERIGLLPDDQWMPLPWMLPAPGQGAIVVLCRSSDQRMMDCCRPLHDPQTAACVHMERDFLRSFGGGCSLPVAACATMHDGSIHFRGNICAPDGSRCLTVDEQYVPADLLASAGQRLARKLMASGGSELMKDWR